MSKANEGLVRAEQIDRLIHVVRGERVILDADLAVLYGVPTKALNQAVKRHARRFPPDFTFKLSQDELESLRSQIVTSNSRGGRRYLPFAFTEHGAIMAANVLNSERAAEASVQVVRAFVRLRQMLATHVELAHKLEELERRMDGTDEQVAALFDAIRQLMSPPQPPRRRIGFRVREARGRYVATPRGRDEA